MSEFHKYIKDIKKTTCCMNTFIYQSTKIGKTNTTWC